MSLFAADPPPSPALAAFTAPAPTTVVASAPSRPGHETAHEKRERLRDERRALVSALSRVTGEPHKVKVGKLTKDQVREIAEVKMPDLNANDIDAAMKIIAGTARQMGITTEL